MVVRSHSEPHRQSSWLELLFDLSIVAAVAQGSEQLGEALAEGHVHQGLVGYLIVFAAIWWAWVAFTWFANAFDTDDVPYRLLTFVMIAGSLGLAAGVPLIARLDFRVGVLSYVIMRLAYVAQWARVLHIGDRNWRRLAVKMMVLVTINQVGWVAFLWVPAQWKVAAFVAWFGVDVATPYLAGWDLKAGGHYSHIAERYGLFTIIVLGEAITAATMAVGTALDSNGALVPLLGLALGALILVTSLWWIYFDFTSAGSPAGTRKAQYLWAHAHYFVFSGVTAVEAGIALAAARLSGAAKVHLADWAVALVIGGALAVVLLSLAVIESVAGEKIDRGFIVVNASASFLVVGAAFAAPLASVPGSVLLMAAILVLVVIYGIHRQHRLHLNPLPTPQSSMQ